MKNKKATLMLGEHVIEIVIAIICMSILILTAIGVSNYFGEDTQNLRQAKLNLAKINDTLSNLKEGEQKEVFIESPSNWVITFWPMTYTGQGAHINGIEECEDKTCICISKYISGDYYPSKIRKCIILEKDFNFNLKEHFNYQSRPWIEIKAPTMIQINLTAQVIKIKEV